MKNMAKALLEQQDQKLPNSVGKRICAQNRRMDPLLSPCQAVYALVLGLCLINAGIVAAESTSTPTVSVRIAGFLPEAMAAFAINANTGDLAAVSPVTNKAYLFRYPQDLFSSSDTNSTITAFRPPLFVRLLPALPTRTTRTNITIMLWCVLKKPPCMSWMRIPWTPSALRPLEDWGVPVSLRPTTIPTIHSSIICTAVVTIPL